MPQRILYMAVPEGSIVVESRVGSEWFRHSPLEWVLDQVLRHRMHENWQPGDVIWILPQPGQGYSNPQGPLVWTGSLLWPTMQMQNFSAQS